MGHHSIARPRENSIITIQEVVCPPDGASINFMAGVHGNQSHRGSEGRGEETGVDSEVKGRLGHRDNGEEWHEELV
ncbi:hypothetical protein E2C01_096562 [Portunus trituberculatus]|uniref:Uncharacterized protein n=1 Tax=Portunus trituberculatus TaxID=210409 RepID=A0A5B7K7C3_PORTR|nr:hypothetical protein [Portunus trituberculatus]